MVLFNSKTKYKIDRDYSKVLYFDVNKNCYRLHSTFYMLSADIDMSDK